MEVSRKVENRELIILTYKNKARHLSSFPRHPASPPPGKALSGCHWRSETKPPGNWKTRHDCPRVQHEAEGMFWSKTTPVGEFRKTACNPTSKQLSSLIVFGLLETVSQTYLALKVMEILCWFQ